jgi:hypothetical protein
MTEQAETAALSSRHDDPRAVLIKDGRGGGGRPTVKSTPRTLVP